MILKMPPRLVSLILLVAALTFALWGCATTSATKARKAQDENTAAYQYDLASVSYNYGLEDEAVRYLEQALALDPDHHPSLFLLSTLRLKRGEHPAAEAGFLKCLALKPEDAEARTRLGMVYRQTGAQDKAEEEFLKAWGLEPSATAALNLAQHFFDLDRLDKALEYTNAALERNDRSVPGLNLRGVILNRLGLYSEASESFRKTLALDPDNVVAAFNLAATYVNLDRLEEARGILEALLLRVEEPKMREKISETLETIRKTPPLRAREDSS